MEAKTDENRVLRSLRQLVGEASALNPRFKEKYAYWVRRRRVSADWLLPQLEQILGKDRIKAEISRII